MSKSQSDALARSGAVLVVVSLLTPWYVLRVGGVSAPGKSGLQALGGLTLVLAALATAAASPPTARLHPRLPSIAAAATALMVLGGFAWPPSAASAFGHVHSAGSLEGRLAESFATGLSSGLGLHYVPVWGLWLATFGAAAMVVGTINASRPTSRTSA